MDVLARVYQCLGLPMTDEYTAQIHSWVAANPQHRHGRHVYSPQRYHLTAESIDEAFADYNARFFGPSRRTTDPGNGEVG